MSGIAKGQWVAGYPQWKRGGHPYKIAISAGGKTIANVLTWQDWHQRDMKPEANALLITEAGTVAHETGLTPRQLAEQRAELLEALQDLVAQVDDHSWLTCEMAAARAAIAKATAQTKPVNPAEG